MRLPAGGSISMNLDGLETRTTVTFDPDLAADHLTLNGTPDTGPALERVSGFLDHVRGMAGISHHAEVHSENNIASGAGIASSSSAADRRPTYDLDFSDGQCSSRPKKAEPFRSIYVFVA